LPLRKIFKKPIEIIENIALFLKTAKIIIFYLKKIKARFVGVFFSPKMGFLFIWKVCFSREGIAK
jgi:hypothetical protein